MTGDPAGRAALFNGRPQNWSYEIVRNGYIASACQELKKELLMSSSVVRDGRHILPFPKQWRGEAYEVLSVGGYYRCRSQTDRN